MHPLKAVRCKSTCAFQLIPSLLRLTWFHTDSFPCCILSVKLLVRTSLARIPYSCKIFGYYFLFYTSPIGVHVLHFPAGEFADIYNDTAIVVWVDRFPFVFRLLFIDGTLDARQNLQFESLNRFSRSGLEKNRTDDSYLDVERVDTAQVSAQHRALIFDPNGALCMHGFLYGYETYDC